MALPPHCNSVPPVPCTPSLQPGLLPEIPYEPPPSYEECIHPIPVPTQTEKVPLYEGNPIHDDQTAMLAKIQMNQESSNCQEEKEPKQGETSRTDDKPRPSTSQKIEKMFSETGALIGKEVERVCKTMEEKSGKVEAISRKLERFIFVTNQKLAAKMEQTQKKMEKLAAREEKRREKAELRKLKKEMRKNRKRQAASTAPEAQ